MPYTTRMKKWCPNGCGHVFIKFDKEKYFMMKIQVKKREAEPRWWTCRKCGGVFTMEEILAYKHGETVEQKKEEGYHVAYEKEIVNNNTGDDEKSES